MAKRTAIIDIGSNSARLVIFQNTSKNGFHLICEQKSRVRIGEGAYENAGNLQPIGMDRAYHTLESFSQTIKEFKVSKVIAVATSALRDAPNRALFLNKVEKKLGLNITIISGKEEALYGAIAANNLLPITDGITIDIGGGSSDISLIKKGKIVESHSLDIGTVRLKELFFDKKIPLATVQTYIAKTVGSLPKSFRSPLAIGIGGTTRTLAKAIIKKENYPLNKLHAFSYTLNDQQDYLKQITSSDLDRLNTLQIKENRHDTIREGTLIFLEILRYIGAKRVMTSGVGVREGVYLHHKLPKPPHKLPANSNPSITSIRDRFDILSLPYGNKKEIATKLYEIFKHHLDHEEKYLPILEKTLSLSNIGKILTIYQKNKHASYIAMQELNYGFTHEEMVLISLLLYSKSKQGYHKAMYKQYKMLLPPKKTVKWLVFMYSLTLMLHRCSTKADIKFSYKHQTLHIKSNKTLYIVLEDVKEMKKPNKLKIVV
jgi:exopolyphosphatase/guanosine-5'-triphosphate,3'-diphosphate pyrophosphatase